MRSRDYEIRLSRKTLNFGSLNVLSINIRGEGSKLERIGNRGFLLGNTKCGIPVGYPSRDLK